MQKVVGSNPISRSAESPGCVGAFVVLDPDSVAVGDRRESPSATVILAVMPAATLRLVSSALVAASLGATSCSGNGAPDADGKLIYVELTADRQGLPKFPKVVGSEKEHRQLRNAEAASRRRLEEAGRRVLRALDDMGVRDATLARGRIVFVRARLSADAARRTRALPNVGGLHDVVRATGRLERYDVGWVLVTAGGRRYALNWQMEQPRDLEAGKELSVEGLTYEYGTFWAPGAEILAVRAAS